ncbi:uncharacterized protein BX663DRAFT_558773 [Cokeromyces recurvatus]|uniref:uncharacterized protein n=1 Tax=Cokeromyces recurvatus TaxID=90255 RepID=UPI00221E6904|nr:uncharacterized protein BX663DRAFT_558773 [Cokeromyces recurvatus]KAI7906240.1 hypothetical protein BX663DRAFT_558773 [Cokeromyces recurvatus]
MTRSIIFVSALLAMVAFVTAAPHNKHHDETTDVTIKKNGAHVLDIPDLQIVDVINNIPIIDLNLSSEHILEDNAK